MGVPWAFSANMKDDCMEELCYLEIVVVIETAIVCYVSCDMNPLVMWIVRSTIYFRISDGKSVSRLKRIRLCFPLSALLLFISRLLPIVSKIFTDHITEVPVGICEIESFYF